MTTAPILSAEILSKRQTLPAKFSPVDLYGTHVHLRPLSTADLNELFSVSSGEQFSLDGRSIQPYDADELIWRYMGSGPFADQNEMSRYIGSLIDNVNGLPMTVV